jgi:hypothetical protein
VPRRTNEGESRSSTESSSFLLKHGRIDAKLQNTHFPCSKAVLWVADLGEREEGRGTFVASVANPDVC